MAVERTPQPRLEDRWDMSEFYAGKAYFEEHFDEIKAKYYEEYVVISHGAVIAHDRDLGVVARFVHETSPERPLYSPFVGDKATRVVHSRSYFPVHGPR